MENKNNFTGIVITVIIAVILLTVLPIINSINVECPPCEDLPTLYTPTISISDDTLTITPNSNNGAFVNGYKIYVDNILLDTTTSTTYDLSEKITELGTYEIYVTAYATLFIDSGPSNIEEYVKVPMSPKAFVVDDILPATTQLKISWENHTFIGGDVTYSIELMTGAYIEVRDDYPEMVIIKIFLDAQNVLYAAYRDGFYIIDTSSMSENSRTIKTVDSYFSAFTYQDVAL